MAFVWQRLATMARLAPIHMSPAVLRVTAFGAQHGNRLVYAQGLVTERDNLTICIDLRDEPRAPFQSCHLQLQLPVYQST